MVIFIFKSVFKSIDTNHIIALQPTEWYIRLGHVILKVFVNITLRYPLIPIQCSITHTKNRQGLYNHIQATDWSIHFISRSYWLKRVILRSVCIQLTVANYQSTIISHRSCHRSPCNLILLYITILHSLS